MMTREEYIRFLSGGGQSSPVPPSGVGPVPGWSGPGDETGTEWEQHNNSSIIDFDALDRIMNGDGAPPPPTGDRMRSPNVSDPGLRGNNGGAGFDPMAGRSFASGQRTASPNRDAGDRRLQNSSVNWGNVAGIQNYLENQMRLGPEAWNNAVQTLLQQGIMPSINGEPLDQVVQRNAQNNGGANFESSTNRQAGRADYGAPSRPVQGSAPGAQNMNPAFARASGQGGPFAGLGQSFGSGSGFQVNTPRLGGIGGKSVGGGFGSSASGVNNQRESGGPLGLPLEGRTQGALLNIFDNPSGLSAEQTNMARNRSANQIDAGAAEQTRSVQEDAVRRGVAPSETAGAVASVGRQQSAQRMDAQQNFDFQNAQQAQQGRLSAAGAANSVMNTQVGNEDSIRRYLAILGQNGQNRPMFMSV